MPFTPIHPFPPFQRRKKHWNESWCIIVPYTAVAKLFWRGCKILRQDVRILPSHFTVTCYPYKEVHVTAKCDGKILTTCHLFCTPGKIVWPRQCYLCCFCIHIRAQRRARAQFQWNQPCFPKRKHHPMLSVPIHLFPPLYRRGKPRNRWKYIIVSYLSFFPAQRCTQRRARAQLQCRAPRSITLSMLMVLMAICNHPLLHMDSRQPQQP